jgi:hypothetical protein
MAGSVCCTEASQRDPQVARQAGTVTEGGPAKTARGTPQHMWLGFVVFIGADGCYKSIRKCEEKESRVE